jgi:hypothetical protein
MPLRRLFETTEKKDAEKDGWKAAGWTWNPPKKV